MKNRCTGSPYPKSDRLTKEDEIEIKYLLQNSTEVVSWYAHDYGDDRSHGNPTVRGPFGRWFECYGGDNGMGNLIKYPTPVAPIENDVKYCAAAMNMVPVLLSEIDVLRKALESIFNESNDNWAAAKAETALGRGKVAVIED